MDPQQQHDRNRREQTREGSKTTHWWLEIIKKIQNQVHKNVRNIKVKISQTYTILQHITVKLNSVIIN